MNILFLTKEYKHENLPDAGGTGSFISNYAKLLVKNGHNVNVFSVNILDETFIDQGVAVKFVKNKLHKNHLYKFLKSISKKIKILDSFHNYLLKYELKYTALKLYKYIKSKNLKIDIIETHDFDGLSLYLNNSIPYVVRCHGSFSIFHEYFNFNVPKQKLIWEKEAIQKARNIITISKYSQKLNHDLFDLKSSRLIYNGLNENDFIFDKKIQIIPKSIFFLGNLSQEKGADTAIQILLQVLETTPSATLHFVGIETQYKLELIKIINKNKIDKNVIFYGYQTKTKVIELISAAEVVIFPSLGETFGLSLCETMLLQKPVIVSNIPSFNEIVEHQLTGFIVDSINDYTKLIIKVFNNEIDLENIKIASRGSIIKKFGQEKMFIESLKYYKEILKQ